MSSTSNSPESAGPAADAPQGGAASGRSALPVESVRRALRILRCFTPEKPELGVSEIARSLGMHKSTAHRLLATLELEGFVHQLEDGRYALSWTVLALAGSIRASQVVRQSVFDHLTSLAGKTRETAHLAVMDRSEVLYIEKVEGSWSLRMPSAVGRRVPLHCSGLGKVLIAGLPEADSRRLVAGLELEAFTPKTIVDRDLLAAEIEKVREQGYGIDREELEEGLLCIAAPVHDEHGRTCAAVSIAGPASRLLSQFDANVASVQATTEALSRALGPYAHTLSEAATDATWRGP